MVGHGGSSAGSYLADPTSPIPSQCASIVATSTLRVKYKMYCCIILLQCTNDTSVMGNILHSLITLQLLHITLWYHDYITNTKLSSIEMTDDFYGLLRYLLVLCSEILISLYFFISRYLLHEKVFCINHRLLQPSSLYPNSIVHLVNCASRIFIAFSNIVHCISYIYKRAWLDISRTLCYNSTGLLYCNSTALLTYFNGSTDL